MELKSKELFLSTLDGVMSVRQDCGLDLRKAESLKDAVQNMPLLVPVVGEFSAGKSSLLNALMGKNILAVAIKAETAIPAELYYSENNYDEGVKQDGSIERIADLSGAAGKYVCVRRHINSQFLRDIEPVVLVDMPGFESSLDSHNKALFNYLDRGTHYAVVIPVNDGTVSRSMKRQIENILSFKKTCTFFLSKTDTRGAGGVEQVKNELERELSVITRGSVTVECLSRDDVSLFSSFVRSLNVDVLFGNQFKDSVLEVCYDTKGSLNTMIAALKSDSEKNRKAVSEIESAIQKIEAKKQNLIDGASRENFSDEADMVASEVGRVINAELDSLVKIAKAGGGELLQEEINNIIQSAVASKIQTVVENISVRFGKELTGEIDGLDKTFFEYIDSSTISKLQQSAEKMFTSVRQNIDAYITERENKSDATVMYKTVTGVIAAATDVMNPVVEVVIIMLPEIMNAILDLIREHRKKELIQDCIISQIPRIKRLVRSKVAESLQQNSSRAIAAIGAKLDDDMHRKKDEIEKVLKEEADNKGETAVQIEKYSAEIKRIDDLIAKVLA